MGASTGFYILDTYSNSTSTQIIPLVHAGGTPVFTSHLAKGDTVELSRSLVVPDLKEGKAEKETSNSGKDNYLMTR